MIKNKIKNSKENKFTDQWLGIIMIVKAIIKMLLIKIILKRKKNNKKIMKKKVNDRE